MKYKLKVLVILGVFFFVAGSGAFSQAEPRKHVVAELDNYYSISLKYDVSIEELKLANPAIANPKPGDVLTIPQKGSIKTVSASLSSDCAKKWQNRHDLFRVALMIPFSLEQLDDTLWHERLDPARINELAPFRFIQFYDGFIMAADSLRKEGLNVEINVYDVDQQVAKMHAVLAKPEMKKMDLIIGPFYKSAFPPAADFAKEYGIPIVNPLSSRTDILQDNPFVFKLLPSVESQPAIVANIVERDYSDYQVLFYIANKYQNASLVGQFTGAIEQADKTGKRLVKVIDYASDSIQGFRDLASKTRPNLVIIYAENEVLPAALLSKLSALKSDYSITVIGLPEWDKLTNIESKYLISLSTITLMSSYVNTRDENVRNFILAYRAKYYDEPLIYALTGFDAGYYFLSALFHYGKDFQSCLDELDVPVIQNQYRFIGNGRNGYDNTYWNVLQYYDYFLIKKSF